MALVSRELRPYDSVRFLTVQSSAVIDKKLPHYPALLDAQKLNHLLSSNFTAKPIESIHHAWNATSYNLNHLHSNEGCNEMSLRYLQRPGRPFCSCR
jgi:hypothetical protein